MDVKIDTKVNKAIVTIEAQDQVTTEETTINIKCSEKIVVSLDETLREEGLYERVTRTIERIEDCISRRKKAVELLIEVLGSIGRSRVDKFIYYSE
jgi:hypothetical protein